MKRRTLTAERDGTLAELLGIEGRGVIERGGAYVDGRRCRDPLAKIKKGALLVAVLEESGRAPPSEAPALGVLFEDDALIAVDKPRACSASRAPAAARACWSSSPSAWGGRPGWCTGSIARRRGWSSSARTPRPPARSPPSFA